MHVVLVVANFLGFIAVVSSFIVLYMGMNVFNLSETTLQSFIYMKRSVAGHLTVLVARTKGPLWSVRPARPLITVILVTQLIATLITVYGLGLLAMGSVLAGFIWVRVGDLRHHRSPEGEAVSSSDPQEGRYEGDSMTRPEICESGGDRGRTIAMATDEGIPTACSFGPQRTTRSLFIHIIIIKLKEAEYDQTFGYQGTIARCMT